MANTNTQIMVHDALSDGERVTSEGVEKIAIEISLQDARLLHDTLNTLIIKMYKDGLLGVEGMKALGRLVKLVDDKLLPKRHWERG